MMAAEPPSSPSAAGPGVPPLPQNAGPAERPLDRLLAWTGVERWSSRGRTSAVLLAVVAVAFLTWSANTTAPLAVILSVGTLIAITLAKRRFFPIPCILAIALSVPLIENFRYAMGQDFIFAGDWWSAVSLLVLLGSTLQYLHAGPRDFRRWRLTGRGDSAALDSGDDLEGHGNGRVRVDIGSLLRLLAGLAAAFVLLRYFPIEKFTPNRFRFDGSVYRIVVIGWLLTLGIAVPGTVVAMIRWRRLSPQQAELHLRKLYGDETEAEHRALERARLANDRSG